MRAKFEKQKSKPKHRHQFPHFSTYAIRKRVEFHYQSMGIEAVIYIFKIVHQIVDGINITIENFVTFSILGINVKVNFERKRNAIKMNSKNKRTNKSIQLTVIR